MPIDSAQPARTYVSPRYMENGESVLSLYRMVDYDVLRFAGFADFYLWPGQIICHLRNPDSSDLVELNLLGPVLSLWLELRSVPALHTSAVMMDRHAVAFLSSSQGGKSTLAAMFVQAGYSLLTDDILPVERRRDVLLGRPGYPTMRLWPDEALHFLGHCEDLELVHHKLTKRWVPVGPGGFGAFCDESQPLACLYVPQRRQPADTRTDVEITPISPRDAVIELVRHSFAAGIIEPLELRPQRLDFFARMVSRVPTRRLVYPSGFEHLPRVRDAILQDLNNLRKP